MTTATLPIAALPSAAQAAEALARIAGTDILRDPYRDNERHSRDADREQHPVIGGTTLVAQADTPRREIIRDLS